MAFDLKQFREVYFAEMEEHLSVIGECLAAMEHGKVSAGLAQEAYRRAHSIKGASATFEHEEVSDRARILANVFDAVAEGRLTLNGRSLAGCRTALEQLVQRVEACRVESGSIPRCEGIVGEGGRAPKGATGERGDTGEPELEGLIAGIRAIVGEIREQVARMEQINREHAAMAARVEGLLQRFGHEIEALSAHPAIGRLTEVLEEASLIYSTELDAERDGIAPTARRRRKGAPLPKVRVGRKGLLADEWEEH